MKDIQIHTKNETSIIQYAEYLKKTNIQNLIDLLKYLKYVDSKLKRLESTVLKYF